MTTFRTRVRAFAAAAALYLIGVSVAALTGVPSLMAVSTMLVAASVWAFGARTGWVVLVLEQAVRVALHGTGTLVTGVPTVALVAPLVFTDVVVLLALAALRRAEFRQAAVETALRDQNAELEAALAEVKELRGMLPICAWCKSVRDVSGMWNRLEVYLTKHSHATFTHGICPTCAVPLAREMEDLSPTA
ncbi:hypothetical protein [Frigoriglobus tundricola]|uniref:Uncharacterized protein n=1 Tax=Frigoriglobus tundricola TaxID=2774151 RepID=A0A6M5YSC4_9BACT|nr:hypothetical protein [Frigoriglobus tundricola]QJW96898.1 hypothetical protein FTUN_4458 [Frigoriglobus tundricola]